MSNNTNQNRFFVYIVESPSDQDIYNNRSEGSLITKYLSLNKIPSGTRTVINKDTLFMALTKGFSEEISKCPGLFPILHLSTHGDQNGIQLCSKDYLTWNELRGILTPINVYFQNILVICMSSCEGLSATKMAMEIDNTPLPFFALVGNHQKPTWSDTAIAYATFYHLLSKNATFTQAVDAMKIASGNFQWYFKIAEEIKKGFIEYVSSRINLEQAQQNLLQIEKPSNI